MKGLTRQITVIISYLVMLTTNALANILPINNQTTGAISDAFPIFFVPAGYVFSIWGLIYVLLLGYVYFQSKRGNRANGLYDHVGVLFVIGSLANTVWIILWHYNLPVLSVLAMTILLTTLLLLYKSIKTQPPSRTEKLFLHIPFSVYLGWISVATIANISVALYSLNWDGFGLSGQVWTAVLLIVVGFITATMLTKHRDYSYYLVIAWATIGILIKFDTEPIIAGTALMLNIILAVFAIYLFSIRDKKFTAFW